MSKIIKKNNLAHKTEYSSSSSLVLNDEYFSNKRDLTLGLIKRSCAMTAAENILIISPTISDSYEKTIILKYSTSQITEIANKILT